MDENKKKNLKIIIPVICFSVVAIVVSIILLAVLLPKRKKNKTIDSVSFNVNTETSNGKKYKDSKFNFLDTDEITFSKGDFVVTINYSDSSFENTTDFTVEVKKEDNTPTQVDVKYNDSYKKSFTIVITKTQGETVNLGLFKNLKEIPEISAFEHAYKYNRDIRWNEESIDAGSLFRLDDDTTLNDLISSNKVSITHSYESLLFNAPNQINDGIYGDYSIIVTAKEGYEFSDGEEKFNSVLLTFTLKRKIIELPVITGSSTFEYQYNESTLEGIKQGLSFDYKGRESIITRPNTESEIGTYTTVLSITDTNKYAFLIDGTETTETTEYSFTITKKALDINEFKIDDQAHFDLNSNTYRYTYTGEHIIPKSNVSNSLKKLLNYSEGGVNASDDIQTVTITFKDLETVQGADNKTYLKNFTWANGNDIEVKDYTLSYYIDKADASIPNNIKNNLSLRSLRYQEGLSIDLYSINSDTKEESWFSESSFDTLKANNISLSAFSFYESIIALGIGENSITVVYCPDEVNYNPLEITLVSNISKGIVNITYSFDINTLKFTFTKDVSSVDIKVSYKYYKVNSDNTTGTEVSVVTDAGNYRVFSDLESNYYYDYYYNNALITSISSDFTVPKTILYLGYNASDCWSNVTKVNSDITTDTNPSEDEWGWADAYDIIPNINTILFDKTKLGNRFTGDYLNVLDYLEFSNVTIMFKNIIRDLDGNGIIDSTEPDGDWHYYPDTTVDHPFLAVFWVSVTYQFKTGVNPDNYIIKNDENGEELTTMRIDLYFRIYQSEIYVELEDSTQPNYAGFDPSQSFTVNAGNKYPEFVINSIMIESRTCFVTGTDTYTIVFPQEEGVHEEFTQLFVNELMCGENTKVILTRNGVQQGEPITPDAEFGYWFYSSPIVEYTIDLNA